MLSEKERKEMVRKSPPQKFSISILNFLFKIIERKNSKNKYDGFLSVVLRCTLAKKLPLKDDQIDEKKSKQRPLGNILAALLSFFLVKPIMEQ